MALNVPSVLDFVSTDSLGATLVSGAFTPTAGSLIVVVFGCQVGTSATSPIASIADDFGDSGGTAWTFVQITKSDTGLRHVGTAIGWRVIGTGPSSGQITVTPDEAANRALMQSLEITGQDSTTPVPQSNTATGTTTTLSVSLTSPAASSLVLGAITLGEENNSATPGAQFTEIREDEVTGGASNERTLQSQYDLGGNDGTCDWSGLNDGPESAGVAIEIAEAPAGGGSSFPFAGPFAGPLAGAFR